jgi:phenylacetate-coenzyme A ligase PaaK-like adenylate-forming protein
MSKGKKVYKEYVYGLLDEAKAFNTSFEKVELTYTYYHGNKRRIDLMNPVSIIDKFTQDALVSYGLYEDDNSLYVPKILIKWGGAVPKDEARCDLTIREMK